MGTCMSKDKKGATVAHTACVSSSRDMHPGQERENTISPTAPGENFENLPSLLARPSEGDCQEVISTDKHVVEIRLPIASPNKYKTSPASATLAVRAMAAIARPAEEDIGEKGGLDVEEEDDEERGANSAPSNVGKSSPPLFYSSYLSGASFSRDLAAFTRDIASLSCSPLKRSPSVNGAHDLIAAAIKAAHMSPQYSGVSKLHANMANDDYSNTTRSRSLPKRFYGKGTQNASLHAPALLHKRSSSRDAVCINAVTLSPRLAVRREEASGEFRVCARQAAARRSAAPTFSQQPQAPVSCSSRVKERSPVSRRSCSKGKVPADAGHTTADNALRFREYRTSSLQTVNTRDKSTGRVVLKEKSTNCVPWVDVSSNSFLRDRKKAVAETKVVKNGRDNFGIARFGGSDKELLHQSPHTKEAQFECTKSPLRCSEKRDNADPDTFAMYPASVQRVHSLIQALADMNIESALLSELEESETEVEGELDLIQFAFDARLLPKKDLQAQHARDLLLKEAAMDAFGRPSFHSNIHPVGLQEANSPGLAALMSMRLPSSEADTSKIREVLKLLSDAESEMGTEQKTLFYNQLRIVLDALKTQTFATENISQEATKVASNITASSVTSRANSWPRSIKEPTHIVVSVDTTSFKEAINCSVHQESSLKVVKPIQSHQIATDQEQIPPELLMASCETAEALEISKCKGLDSDKPGLKLCHADEENSHPAEQAEESPNAGLLSGQVRQVDEEVIEGHCGVENAEEPHAQIQYGHNSNYFADLDHYEVAACSLSDYLEGEGCTKVAGGLISPPSALVEVENICELQGEGTTEGEDMFDLRYLFQQGCLGNDVHASSQRSIQASAKTSVTLLKEAGCGRSEEVGSDGSFEFGVRSSVSTPLSTPSTPRHFNHMLSAAPLNAQKIAEIWQAFD